MSTPTSSAMYGTTPPVDPFRDVERDAEVVAGHLPSGYTAEFDGENESVVPRVASPASSSRQADESPDLEGNQSSSLKLQGGDIHRDLFKTAARVRMHQRAHTFAYHRDSHDGDDDEEPIMSVSNQMAPGGARRAFIRQYGPREPPKIWAESVPVARNFVEFLDLYGNFAGEDLADSDDEAVTSDGEEPEEGPSETRPLLGRRRSSKRIPRSASASTTKTFFTLLKAFIGTGIMFLPKAFNNGGILFSSLVMVAVAILTQVSFHLLLVCKARHGGGYGDIGQAVQGPFLRALILGSITLSQLGFVCAGIVFVAENILSFLKAIANGPSPLSLFTLVGIQLIVLIPLSLVRNIAKLGPYALLADVCILLGVGYIYYYDISYLATEGMNPTVKFFNPEKYTLTIGAAIFTFEGIGLILPIQSSMAKPERFEWLLGTIMLIITLLFTSIGALCYATFGSDTSIEIIDNYPQSNRFVNAVQFIYSVAVLVGTPVQLFPALRIMEGKIFGPRSGKRSVRTKWTKNLFRVAVVLVCGLISIAGASNLDRFVALIGSVACVPLVYIYPAYMHWKSIATTWQAKTGDVLLMVVGAVGMVYTTVITILNSFM